MQYSRICRIENFSWQILIVQRKNIISVLWSLVLIAMGNLLTKVFRMLACESVGDKTVHFYAGYLDCYGPIWFNSLCVLLLIIIFWGVVWYRLYKMDKHLRDNNLSSMRTVTKAYKPKYWYWEIILISRRILLSAMITFDYFKPDYFKFSLLIILLVYLCIQIMYIPFRYNKVNNIEFLCMLMLCIALGCIICDIESDNTDIA